MTTTNQNRQETAAGVEPERLISQAPTSHDSLKALGSAVALMMASPAHRYLFLIDLESMILPPILLGQAKLYSTEKGPVAFAAWAKLTEEAESRLREPNARLAPADWNGGDRLWLMQVIAPFGHQETVIRDLRETALRGQKVQFHWAMSVVDVDAERNIANGIHI